MATKNKVSKLVNIRKLTIPNDNKCFFHCINQACFNNIATVDQLKQICARTVLTDNFYEPFLATTKEAYAKDVMHPDFWGGHVEQVVFSRECGVEFVIIFSDGRDIRRVSCASTPPTKRVYLEYCGKEEGRFTHYNLYVHGKNDSTCGVFETDDPDAELAAVLNVALSEGKTMPTQKRTEEQPNPNTNSLPDEKQWGKYQFTLDPYSGSGSDYSQFHDSRSQLSKTITKVRNYFVFDPFFADPKFV